MPDDLQQMSQAQQLLPQVSQTQQFQNQPPLIAIADWLLSNPSIPLEFRKQFIFLWEIVVFGNFDDYDRQFLLLKFEEWKLHTLAYIPDKHWGHELTYNEPDGSGGISVMRQDLNTLFNILEQAYYIQLTRGKEGFTLKEMTSIRDIKKIEETEKKKKTSWW